MPPAFANRRLLRIVLAVLAGGLAIFALVRPAKTPAYPRWAKWPADAKRLETAVAPHTAAEPDVALVRALLAEDLGNRSFSFATIAEAASGKRVLPLDRSPSHQRAIAAIQSALAGTVAELNQPDSPVRQLRRINEASRFFEDRLLTRLNEIPGILCEIPATRDGTRQRSGYPDLRITDSESKLVFYLDPKLFEQGSADSTFRSFYFEPKSGTLKINDDAVHLLAGIEHDGEDGRWTFTGWRLVDLSQVQVRLKAEFQASNAELYRETSLSLPATGR